jgi:hypothetical protein
MTTPDHDFVAHFLEAHRQRALAESGLGNHERAAALLDELLEKHGQESNRLLVGLLHQARAEIAERAGDRAAADSHRAEMETRFRKTQNPSLIAQCERAQRGVAVLPATLGAAHSVLGQSTISAQGVATMSAFAGALGPSRLAETLGPADDSMEGALELLMKQSKAKTAYLYVAGESALQLAWSSTNREAPVGWIAELGKWLDVVRENVRDESTQEGRSALVVETEAAAGYRLVALRSGAERTVIGGLILEPEPKMDLLGSSDMFDAVGRAVEAHGHDVLGFVTA